MIEALLEMFTTVFIYTHKENLPWWWITSNNNSASFSFLSFSSASKKKKKITCLDRAGRTQKIFLMTLSKAYLSLGRLVVLLECHQFCHHCLEALCKKEKYQICYKRILRLRSRLGTRWQMETVRTNVHTGPLALSSFLRAQVELLFCCPQSGTLRPIWPQTWTGLKHPTKKTLKMTDSYFFIFFLMPNERLCRFHSIFTVLLLAWNK